MSGLNPSGNRRKSKETGGKTGKSRKNEANSGEKRKEPEKSTKSLVRDQKDAGKGFDDRRRRKFHRILSQPIGSELHSVESRPYRLRPEGESRHFDSPGHCKSMLSGFCFSCGFSALQPSRLQRGGKARFSALKNLLPHFSVNFRLFQLSKCPV